MRTSLSTISALASENVTTTATITGLRVVPATPPWHPIAAKDSTAVVPSTTQ